MGTGSAGTHGHLIRAFSCAVLLRVAAAPKMWRHTDHDDTLIQLLGSVVIIGRDASECALRFLAWYVLNVPPENEDFPCFALGVLLLYAAQLGPGDDPADLEPLANWVIAIESQVRNSEILPESDAWLLGLVSGQRQERWPMLARKILGHTSQEFPGPVADALRGIVQRLSVTQY